MSIHTKNYYLTRKITVLGMLTAVAIVLQMLEFPVPFLIPPFVKMDFSDLPELLAAFAYGPISGIAVCLLKNAIHITATNSAAVGELANFLLGAFYCGAAGLFYRAFKTRKGAAVAGAFASLVMGLASIPVNYFLTYPFYVAFYEMPLETIIGMYQLLLPSVDGLLPCLLIFNLPFTVLKGALVAVIAFFVYKPLSPFFHAREREDTAV